MRTHPSFFALAAALILALSFTADRTARAQAPCYAVDLWQNQCAGSTEGQLFKATDGPLHAVYSNGQWQYFFNDLAVSPLVNNSVFTGAPAFAWVNKSNAAVTSIGGCLYLEAPKAAAATGNLNLYNAPSPPAPYSWTVPMLLNLTGQGDDAGIAVRSSATGRLTTISLKGGLLSVFHMTDPTHWHDTVLSQYFGYMYPLIYRIADDGSFLTYSWSNDGHDFIPVFKEARTAWLQGSPDGNAIYVDADANDFNTGGTFCGFNYN